MKQYTIPIFIPHEGCRHACTFCNQRRITGVETTVTPQMARSMIQQRLEQLPREGCHIEVAFFGGSFTGLSLSVQEAFYRVAEEFRPQIHGLRLSTRPDTISDETLTLAKAFGVSVIELGAQSSSDEVLTQNKRGHTFLQTCQAVKKIREFGIGVGLQMMTGMYGSDEKRDEKTAIDLAELRPNCVRIYPTLVLKNTALEDLYRAGSYRPQTMEEAITVAKKASLIFREKGIPVIRLGLHGGEELQEEGTIIAGPFHPALGELVENRIWRDEIEAFLQAAEHRSKELELIIPKGTTSKILGHKGCNRSYFKEKYHITLRAKERDEGSKESSVEYRFL